jgi:hypothetical protein
VSSYNNPALEVFLEATIPQYDNGWPVGAERLMLISRGTGYYSPTIESGKASSYCALDWARYPIKDQRIKDQRNDE